MKNEIQIQIDNQKIIITELHVQRRIHEKEVILRNQFMGVLEILERDEIELEDLKE